MAEYRSRGSAQVDCVLSRCSAAGSLAHKQSMPIMQLESTSIQPLEPLASRERNSEGPGVWASDDDIIIQVTSRRLGRNRPKRCGCFRLWVSHNPDDRASIPKSKQIFEANFFCLMEKANPIASNSQLDQFFSNFVCPRLRCYYIAVSFRPFCITIMSVSRAFASFSKGISLSRNLFSTSKCFRPRAPCMVRKWRICSHLFFAFYFGVAPIISY